MHANSTPQSRQALLRPPRPDMTRTTCSSSQQCLAVPTAKDTSPLLAVDTPAGPARQEHGSACWLIRASEHPECCLGATQPPNINCESPQRYHNTGPPVRLAFAPLDSASGVRTNHTASIQCQVSGLCCAPALWLRRVCSAGAEFTGCEHLLMRRTAGGPSTAYPRCKQTATTRQAWAQRGRLSRAGRPSCRRTATPELQANRHNKAGAQNAWAQIGCRSRAGAHLSHGDGCAEV